MKQFLDKTQKIVATCILQKDNKILLLRGNQVLDNDVYESEYFNVPRFEIDFGEIPTVIILEKFASHFNQEICSVKVIDAHQRLVENDSVQIFEIIYKVQCKSVVPIESSIGKFLFADISELELYMLENHQIWLSKYLD